MKVRCALIAAGATDDGNASGRAEFVFVDDTGNDIEGHPTLVIVRDDALRFEPGETYTLELREAW